MSFLLFISELFILFSLSRRISQAFFTLFVQITRSQKLSVGLLAGVFLPGTIIHELAHLLTAGVLLVPVGDLDVIPQVNEQGVQLGSVQIAKTDPLRRLIIGVAPVLVGLAIILGVLYFVSGFISTSTPWWQIFLTIYVIFVIGNTMFSSKKDMEGALAFLLSILVVVILIVGSAVTFGIFSISGFWSFVLSINLGLFDQYFKTASFYLTVPIGIDLLVIFLTSLIVKRF